MKLKSIYFTAFLFLFQSSLSAQDLGIGFQSKTQINKKLQNSFPSQSEVGDFGPDLAKSLKKLELVDRVEIASNQQDNFENLIKKEQAEVELLKEINEKLEVKKNNVEDQEFIDKKVEVLERFSPTFFVTSDLQDNGTLKFKNKNNQDVFSLKTYSLTSELDSLMENENLENKDSISSEREKLKQSYISTLNAEISDLENRLKLGQDSAQIYLDQAKLQSLNMQKALAENGKTIFTPDNFSGEALGDKAKQRNELLKFLIQEKQKEAKKDLNDLKLSGDLDLEKIKNLEKFVLAELKVATFDSKIALDSKNIEKKHYYLTTIGDQKKLLDNQISSEEDVGKKAGLEDRLKKINLRIKQIVLSDYPQELEYYKLKSELDQQPSPDAQAAFELIKNKKDLEQSLILLDSYKKGLIEFGPEKLSEIYSKAVELEKSISSRTNLFSKVMSFKQTDPILSRYSKMMVLEQNNKIWLTLSEDEKEIIVGKSERFQGPEDIIQDEDLMKKIIGPNFKNLSVQDKLNKLDQINYPEKYFEKNLALNFVKQDFEKTKEILNSFNPLVTQVENENNIYPDRGNKILRGLRRFKKVLVGGIKQISEKISISKAVASTTKNTIKQFLKAKILNPKLIVATIRENVGGKIAEIKSGKPSVSEIVRRLENSSIPKNDEFRKKAIGASSLILGDENFKTNFDVDNKNLFQEISDKKFADFSNEEKSALKIYLGGAHFDELSKGKDLSLLLKESVEARNKDNDIIYSDDIIESLKEIKNQKTTEQPQVVIPKKAVSSLSLSVPNLGSESGSRTNVITPSALPPAKNPSDMPLAKTPSALPPAKRDLKGVESKKIETQTSKEKKLGGSFLALTEAIPNLGKGSGVANKDLNTSSKENKLGGSAHALANKVIPDSGKGSGIANEDLNTSSKERKLGGSFLALTEAIPTAKVQSLEDNNNRDNNLANESTFIDLVARGNVQDEMPFSEVGINSNLAYQNPLQDSINPKERSASTPAKMPEPLSEQVAPAESVNSVTQSESIKKANPKERPASTPARRPDELLEKVNLTANAALNIANQAIVNQSSAPVEFPDYNLSIAPPPFAPLADPNDGGVRAEQLGFENIDEPKKRLSQVSISNSMDPLTASIISMAKGIYENNDNPLYLKNDPNNWTLASSVAVEKNVSLSYDGIINAMDNNELTELNDDEKDAMKKAIAFHIEDNLDSPQFIEGSDLHNQLKTIKQTANLDSAVSQNPSAPKIPGVMEKTIQRVGSEIVVIDALNPNLGVGETGSLLNNLDDVDQDQFALDQFNDNSNSSADESNPVNRVNAIADYEKNNEETHHSQKKLSVDRGVVVGEASANYKYFDPRKIDVQPKDVAGGRPPSVGYNNMMDRPSSAKSGRSKHK